MGAHILHHYIQLAKHKTNERILERNFRATITANLEQGENIEFKALVCGQQSCSEEGEDRGASYLE